MSGNMGERIENAIQIILQEQEIRDAVGEDDEEYVADTELLVVLGVLRDCKRLLGMY